MNHRGNISEPAPPETGRPSHSECGAILLISLAALLLRAAVPDRMAVEHFDEGVYASNWYCQDLDPPEQFPDRHLYAPPLLPELLEWPLSLTGNAASVMWVNVAAGTLMVLLVWWTTREWFGPAAGLIAAVLAATSDYHIAFSRAALTDALLALWMLAGVYAGWRAVLSRGPIWIGAAGLLAGLAWCTKYNGWLTLAVTGSGAAGWLLVSRPRSASWAGVLLKWGATAAIAAGLFWVVAVRGLADLGGYATVAENHARYFTGLSGWGLNVLQHVAAHRVLDGWASWLGLAAAGLLAVILPAKRFTWNGLRGWLAIAAVAAGLLAVAILWGTTVVLFLIAAIGLLIRLKRLRQPADAGGAGAETDRGTADEPRRLAGWLLAAWFIGLFIGTPLYHPYPRLSLVWLTAAWIAAAWSFSRAVGEAAQPGRRESPALRRLAVGGCVIVLLVLAGWRLAQSDRAVAAAWDDRTGMQSAALRILDRLEEESSESGSTAGGELDAVIYVYAEPALFFQLEAARGSTALEYVTQPAGNLDLLKPGATDPRVATYLLTGPHADRSGAGEALASADARLLAEFDYRPSRLVRLDQSPRGVLESPDPPIEQIRLYRIHSGDSR